MSPIKQLSRGLINIVTFPVRVLLTAPKRLLGSFQGLKSVSLPARVAIFTAVFLVLYAIGFAVVYSRNERTRSGKSRPTASAGSLRGAS